MCSTLYVPDKAKKATGLEQQSYAVDATELIISQKETAKALTDWSIGGKYMSCTEFSKFSGSNIADLPNVFIR